ncbi:NmrA-like family-domain-containing protein [Phyllosticta citriasiana]|uniref:NmrA-like family-domain-containing protein n=1 Tax=Phyllosticta citriasiana TaxID=595635 RepID=A0ABR1KIB2_9PEZI
MEPHPPSQRILIFGATGKIGAYITSAIADVSPSFARVAIYTSTSTVTGKAAQIEALKARGVEVIVGELDDDDKIKEAYMGFDTIVSCLGRAILSHQTHLITLAANPSNPILRFFPSEYGTDIFHPVTPDPHREPPHKFKLEARELLERLAAGSGSGSGEKKLSHTYIVTGPYAEFYVSTTGKRGVDAGENAWDRAGGFDVARRRATLLFDDSNVTKASERGSDPMALTTMPDTALFVVSALRRAHVSHNAALRCHSFVTTPAAILAEFERQTSGRGTWGVRYLGLGELREREREAYERGDAEKGLFSVRRIWTMGGSVYDGWREGRGWDEGVLMNEGGEWERGTLEGVVRGEIERQMNEAEAEAEK